MPNDQQLREYEANGFVLARKMFDEEETGLLRRAAKEDGELDQHFPPISNWGGSTKRQHPETVEQSELAGFGKIKAIE